MNNLKLILGGPGCGKTTRLLQIVEQEMNNGVPPSAIAFVTFTKAAAEEAKQRAAAQFSLSGDDLPWFRTIHSLAYARLNIQRDEMLTGKDWQEFAEMVNEPMSGGLDASDGAPIVASGREIGDVLLRICDYAATTMMPLDEAWHSLNEPVPWFRLKRFADALTQYKSDTGRMDFTDLLKHYAASGPPVPVQVAVIDEAQDLTAAQWAAVKMAFSGVERTFVGGDDDQAIYHWAGADVAQFLTLSDMPEVLPISHRLPRQIHSLATKIAARITARYHKRFAPSEREGTITWHQHPSGVEFANGSWLILARNNYMLFGLEKMIREQGYVYTRRSGPSVSPMDVKCMQLWERLRTGKVADMAASEARALAKALDQPKPQTKELQRYTLASFGWQVWAEHPWYMALTGISPERRDYYLACLRRGERLTKPPRLRIETIHGVKGAEADHVLLMTDMSDRTAKSFRLNEDAEHRVFYVGVTRALKSLHLVMPQSFLNYPLYFS